MVAKKDLFEAADRLARDRHVTQRLLHETLGGSFEDIGPLLNEWKGANDYDTRLGKAGVPAALHPAVARAAGELWKAALAHAEGQLEGRRRELAVQAEAIRESVDAIRQVGSQVEQAGAEVEELRRQNEALKARCEKAERLAQRYRAEEFWDRVMQAIEKIMPAAGTMSGADVLRLLAPDYRKECLSHSEKWTLGTLNKKMGVRSEHTNYFTMYPDGRFGRLVDAAVAGDPASGGIATEG